MSPSRKSLCSACIVATFSLAAAAGLHAQNPLGLTPGVASNATLGQIVTLSNFNTSIATGEISYTNSDLATRQYVVRLPLGYNATDTTKKYGLITYIDAGDAHTFPSSYAAALDAHDIIWIGGQGIGNPQSTNLRMGVAIMGAFRMTQLYNIDPSRIYVSGLSGGGRTASSLGYLRHDFFRGFIGRVGASIPGTIPGWECAGQFTSGPDDNYEVGSGSSVVLPAAFRTALMTQTGDFRRAENLAIYRWGHLNHGNVARAIVRPGGHSDEVGDSFTDAVRFLYHPHVDVIWDRFENGLLAANVHAGKTAAGSGFSALAGNVTETTYSYNSVNHGVLRLAGDGALAQANDAFAWKDNSGVLVDARVRSQNATTAGQNQQIGLHIVADGSTGAVASRPGFHVYWCYGAPYRAEVVSVTGERRTLATWEHAATHPMSLAATDRTFWGNATAPDAAGKTQSFRGEDVRVVLNATGFQLTFNRFANNVQTTYPGVTINSQDTSTPYAEQIPMVLQGLWSSVETALVNALPSGNYRLLVSNSAITTGQPVGTAVVDEIRVVGSSGQQAAPATITVTAPSNGQRYVTWSPIQGALGYVVERSTSPDTGFATLATVPNVGWTATNASSSSAASNPAHTDTTASNSSAYYYRVAAIGANATTGLWSATGFAARTGTVPATPTAPGVTYPAAYEARLAWTDAANSETGYRIERSPAGFAQWTLVTGSLAANSNNFTDTNLQAGVSYDYRISAINAAGLSGYASVTASIPDVAPPTPGGLGVDSTTFTTANLSWTAVPQAASYRVKRADVSGGPYTTVASGLSAAAFTDTGLTPGTAYFYVVSAVGAALESANSSEVTATTAVLAAPTGLTVTPGFTTNTLTWNAAAGVTTYVIERAAAADGPFTQIGSTSDVTFTDTGLSSGITSFYRVRSLGGTAQSTPSTAASGTPVAGTATKANNTTALDVASSWDTNVLPTPLDTARWAGTYANGTVSIGSGLSVGTLQLASPSTAITITPGTGNLTLGAGGIDLGNATQNLGINAPVALAANQTWTIASGRTLTLAVPVLASALPAPDLTLAGNGTLSFNGTGSANLAPGRLAASGATLRVNQAAGNLTLGSANFPAGSSANFTSITGAAGARLVIDADPSARLAFASNTAGFTLIIRGGNITYNALSGNTDATNVRVEGGLFAIASTSARYQLAAANQTFDLAGGTVDVSRVTSFGFRVGGSGSATQAGAQNVVATQSGGTLLASFCSVGGSDTVAARSPSYSLTGGNFTVNSTALNALQIGADSGGNGTSTFSLGGGKLIVPGTISGGQSGARQIFAMTGGTLVAGTITATNLRSNDAAANGIFTQSGGTLAPGDTATAGRTTINGAYSLAANATVAIDVGGATQAAGFQNGQYDLVAVTGTTSLAGQLRVRLINGFTPGNATSFTVLTSSGSLSGAFSNVAFGSRVSTEGGEGSFLVTQSGNSVVLSAYQSALSPLESWRQLYFGTSANTGPAADNQDFDGDGVSNLVEYALNTLPNSTSSGANPGSEIVANRLQLTFQRARSDVTYLVEASNDLSPGSWQTIATNPGTVGSNVTVTDSVDLTGASNQRRFIRLRVTAP